MPDASGEEAAAAAAAQQAAHEADDHSDSGNGPRPADGLREGAP